MRLARLDQEDTVIRLKRVIIGLPRPHTASISKQTANSLSEILTCYLFKIKVIEVQTSTIAVGRNLAVKEQSFHIHQTDFDFDYFLSLDSDIEFKSTDVQALIDRNLPVISGAYKSRANKGKITAGYFSVYGMPLPETHLNESSIGLIQCDWVGAGFLLIKREVFEKIEYPWFRDEIVKFNYNNIPCAAWVGEDVGFCMQCTKRGFPIFVDTDVKVNHIL